MEMIELYDPQIAVHVGGYAFTQGIEIELYSAKFSHFDWAKIRFTGQYRPELWLDRNTPASVELGYDGVLNEVFTGYVAKPYDGGAYANEIILKDEMQLLENTVINGTFLNTTPQEMIAYILSCAGVSKMKLAAKNYPVRKSLSIYAQNAIQAIDTVSAAWGLKASSFFSGGTFYWDEKPEQQKVYSFVYGGNILSLERTGGLWKLETVSVPFVKHSHRIDVSHPQVSGLQEVLKVVTTTNDSGFIRTYIYF